MQSFFLFPLHKDILAMKRRRVNFFPYPTFLGHSAVLSVLLALLVEDGGAFLDRSVRVEASHDASVLQRILLQHTACLRLPERQRIT